jgi:hypothetical protein
MFFNLEEMTEKNIIGNNSVSAGTECGKAVQRLPEPRRKESDAVAAED